MQKTILITLLCGIFTITGCSEKKKEATTKTQKKNVVLEQIDEENSTKIKPFTPSIATKKTALELNISMEDINMSESLDNLGITALKTIQPHIIEEMKNMPECLASAASKQEAFECSKKLRNLNQELAMSLGDFSEDAPQSYDDDFIWDEETKSNMIEELTKSVQEMQYVQQCLDKTTSASEMQSCMDVNL